MSSLGARHRKPSLYDAEPEEPPTKRRRVASTKKDGPDEKDQSDDTVFITKLMSCSPERDSSALPASPTETAALFSDEAPRSSPPSSPIPQSCSPPARKRRPMFSFVKRRSKSDLLAKKPLSEKSHNISNPPQHASKKNKKLVQMQLDLVADPNKKCKICGMEYVPSHAEDAALHRKFHAMNVGGVDISKALSERLRRNQVWSGGERSFIAVVSRRDALALRNKASEVLKVVNTELGAVPISDEALWSQRRNSIATNAPTQEEKAQHSRKGNAQYSASDRYKAYLYIHGQKCVGACLAERIQEAFPVLDQDDASEAAGQLPADIRSSSICISDTRERAILGISRIWTSNSHRKNGIATTLLESARSNFLYAMTIDKAKMAFSQPTESGGLLARKWFGGEAGWLVYID
ncbi:hypothetical protein N0V90_010299 [Kalmusia sp. IMI 367209]|nr:hypothetical protein N0V90_010299 [Kalmusia sp. IMI 367209]